MNLYMFHFFSAPHIVITDDTFWHKVAVEFNFDGKRK